MQNHETYLKGFGNHFESEALPGALPSTQNSPKLPPYGLYAEQLSGTAFTAPRSENKKVWFYRIAPSVIQGSFRPVAVGDWLTGPGSEAPEPNPLRWDPMPEPKAPTDFVSGLHTMARTGSFESRAGLAVHGYAANQSMKDTFLFNADGEFLVLPEKGSLEIRTECGDLTVSPGELAGIPRGMKFQVNLKDKSARGYVAENFGEPFRLPTLGVIGANGLADPRHFLSPKAKYEDLSGQFRLLARSQGGLFEAELKYSPLDVVAWQGNYVPYKYDLRLFQPVGSISVDHPDPSIFTVLTSPSAIPGTANCDFVIFPPRWLVAQNTFRPPYYHRNVMSEFMGLIYGEYDAKPEGFVPGGSSLHNAMQPHGPDADSFAKAISGGEAPVFLDKTLAFMFETGTAYQVTKYARSTSALQKNYAQCWAGLKRRFDASAR